MTWYQKEITISAKKRGCHLIQDDIVKQVPEISKIKMGLCHIFIKHTSASLAMNENWDPDVRVDTEMMLNKLIPESTPFKHSCEGPDDMVQVRPHREQYFRQVVVHCASKVIQKAQPAHLKALFLGSSVSVPITDGRLNTGTWQGLWMCEHRNHASGRHLVVTVQGQPK